MTLTFDLTHDLDLEFWNSSIVGLIDVKQKCAKSSLEPLMTHYSGAYLGHKGLVEFIYFFIIWHHQY